MLFLSTFFCWKRQRWSRLQWPQWEAIKKTVRKAIQKSLSFWWRRLARRNVSLHNYGNREKERSPQSRYSYAVNLISHVGPNTCAAAMVTSGERRQHKRNGTTRISHSLDNKACLNGVHVIKKSPAAHLCPATSRTQAQRNQTHGSL